MTYLDLLNVEIHLCIHFKKKLALEVIVLILDIKLSSKQSAKSKLLYSHKKKLLLVVLKVSSPVVIKLVSEKGSSSLSSYQGAPLHLAPAPGACAPQPCAGRLALDLFWCLNYRSFNPALTTPSLLIKFQQFCFQLLLFYSNFLELRTLSLYS